MRHVSQTHRVALDRLFDRINLDPKIQIKYVDTKNQLADTLTKGNFTRDEWQHLLTLFNISNFSSACCPKVSALQAALEQFRKDCKKEVKADDEFGFEDHGQFFNSTEFEYTWQPGDTQSIQSKLGSSGCYIET